MGESALVLIREGSTSLDHLIGRAKIRSHRYAFRADRNARKAGLLHPVQPLRRTQFPISVSSAISCFFGKKKTQHSVLDPFRC